MNAKEAYKHWQEQYKINMQVHTNEQMFEIGYNMREGEIKVLYDLIDDLDAKLALTKKPTVKKVKANANK